MCSKGKYCAELMAQLKTRASGEGITKSCTTCLRCPSSDENFPEKFKSEHFPPTITTCMGRPFTMRLEWRVARQKATVLWDRLTAPERGKCVRRAVKMRLWLGCSHSLCGYHPDSLVDAVSDR
jgi:hypothetical protein